jgi:tRNA(fMet)-specific endonuclease VapC
VILVDTSAWIEFFRGREPLAGAVDDALAANSACLCGPVSTELRRGLTKPERARVLPLLTGCHWLAQPDDLWSAAGDLGYALRRQGMTAKTVDLLIAVHALTHSAALLTGDRDFATMRKAGVPLQLMP